ncbi:MAG: T9SS type A sorting domain-containing protein, partial [Bacteroidia bacterium]|nr:T9SS type A sorting domain-containing protein [Bacteroidia bacterium]
TLVVTNSNTCNGSDTTNIILNISSCTQIKTTPALNESISVFPNPTKGMFTIKTDSFNFDSEFIIFDVLGKIVLQNKISSTTTQVDLSKYSNGVYYLKIKESKNQRMIKVIKE